MRLYQITKIYKIITFTLCFTAVWAQQSWSQNQDSQQNELTQALKKSGSKISKKSAKNIKKNKTKTPKKPSKNAKKLPRKIVKKITLPPIEGKVITNSILLTDEVDHLFTSKDNYQYNEEQYRHKPWFNYLLNIELKENCKKTINEDCVRSDNLLQDPYYHQTKLSIFYGKIIAEQYFENYKIDKKFFLINDGEYIFKTTNDTKIKVTTKNSYVIELEILDGDLKNEMRIANKCQYIDKFYAFNKLNHNSEFNEKTIYYLDEEKFNGLIELKLFNEKKHPSNLYSLVKTANKEFRVLQNLNLCKIKDDIVVRKRNDTYAECKRKFNCISGLIGLSADDSSITQQSSDNTADLITVNKQNDLAENSANKLYEVIADEINNSNNKELKDLIQKRCFNDKNIDILECSKQERCKDYVVINQCEVEEFKE